MTRAPARTPRSGRPPRTPEQLAERIREYLTANGPQTEHRLGQVLASKNRDNFPIAMSALLASGAVVLEERVVVYADGRSRPVRRVRLPEQALEDDRMMGTPRDPLESHEDPDGTCPLWQRLDSNTRLSVELALPLLSPAVRGVVQAVLDKGVWSRSTESYALSWFVIEVTESLHDRGLLTYGVMRELFG